MKYLAFALLLCGCGFHNGATPDAGGDDTPPDSPPDGPPPALSVHDSCTRAEVASFDFGTVAVGQTETVHFDVGGFNLIATTTGDPAFSAGSTAGLDVALAASAPGDFHATVTIVDVSEFGNANPPTATLAVTGHVIEAVEGLAASTPSFQIGIGLPIQLVNTSTTMPIDLDSWTVTSSNATPSLAVDSQDCPTTLEPGAGCTITPSIGFQVPPGCNHYTLHVHSSANTVDINVDERSTVDLNASSVNGTIMFAPSSSTCSSASCPESFDVGPVVVSPIAGTFQGWGNTICDQSPTCEFPFATPTMFPVTGRFAGAVTQTITVVGPGSVVYIDDAGTMTCAHTCTVTPVGTPHILAASTSHFTSWSGSCSGTDPHCFPGIGSAAVTATFALDPHEVATLTPPQRTPAGGPASVGILPGGDLVVGNYDTLARITASGSVVWRQNALVRGLAITPTGEIVYLSGLANTPTLVKLAPDGTPMWSRDLIHPNTMLDCDANHRIAVLPNGDVAVIAYEQLRIVSGSDGSDVFSDAFPSCEGVTVDSGGHLAVLVVANSTIRRYANAVRVMPDFSAPQGSLDLAYDPGGALDIVSNTVDGGSTLTRLGIDGTPTFAVTRAVISFGVIAASNGTIVTSDRTENLDLVIHAYDVTGTELWSVTRPRVDDTTVTTFVGASHLAADATGHVAVIGAEAATSKPWVDLLDATASTVRRTTPRPAHR